MTNLQMPSHLYRTFQIASPVGTHFRPERCEEVECPAHINGWNYRVSVLDPEMISLIRTSGRHYKEVEYLGETYWAFPPGQQCFERHMVPLERPALFYEGRGDKRSYSRRNAREWTADQWVNRFAEHQDKINTAIQRG